MAWMNVSVDGSTDEWMEEGQGGMEAMSGILLHDVSKWRKKWSRIPSVRMSIISVCSEGEIQSATEHTRK